MQAKESLALKYRPAKLSSLIGQEHITKQLEGMIAGGKIAQTIMFTGPSGTGKTTLARMLARYANCQNLNMEKMMPCGECVSCQRKAHPDIHELNMAESRGIDDIRDLINKSNYTPQMNLRFFIIDECHMLTTQAQQAFLKPLEEPPQKTVWVLCTTNPEKFPNTIIQRCRMFELRTLDNEQCTKLLARVCKREGFEFPKEQLSYISALVKCQPRSALKALEGVMEYCQRESVKDGDLEKLVPEIIADIVPVPPFESAAIWLNSIYNGKFSDAILEVEKTSEYDFFLRTLIENHRYVMYRQFGPKTYNLIKLDAKPLIKVLEAKDYAFNVEHDIMAEILDQMIVTYGKLKDYTIDAKSLITVLTTRCVVIAKKGMEANAE